MKEDFLHYLWKFKKFDFLNLKTTSNEEIIIQNSGQYLGASGPDFFNAQIIIANQKWAGNVEIHIKSSDWYIHHHENDSAYENVILHVVWEHDVAVFRENNTEIPVLELKNFVSDSVLKKYNSLAIPKTWILCENEIQSVDNFVLKKWQERLFFERLEAKSKLIFRLLNETNQDWEAVLFCLLAKNFGLNTNGNSFLQLAKSIPFSIIRKESFEVENLESLFFGNLGLLNKRHEDIYPKNLEFRFFYLKHKYQLADVSIEKSQFFKLRPDNFPTIRLSQLANLYHKHQNLFSKLIGLKSVESMRDVLQVCVSNYWQTHYVFDKESSKKSKKLSISFINLIIINTIVPLQFAYGQSNGDLSSEDLILLLTEIKAESNTIIDKFKSFGITSENAFESQSLLQLKNEYCNHQKCLNCSVGIELLKNV